MSKVTVGEVVNTAINIFVYDCIKETKDNWSQNQVDMLKRLFECCKKGCPYKCVECEYFGRASDAPDTVPEECMWTPSEDENNRPCDDE